MLTLNEKVKHRRSFSSQWFSSRSIELERLGTPRFLVKGMQIWDKQAT
jgi:hypothetical protein